MNNVSSGSTPPDDAKRSVSEAKKLESPDKCLRFEEVETKLEEMFAGIDDEGDILKNNKRPGNVEENVIKDVVEKLPTKAAVKCTEYASSPSAASSTKVKPIEDVVSKTLLNKPSRRGASTDQTNNNVSGLQNGFKANDTNLTKLEPNDFESNFNTIPTTKKNKVTGNNRKNKIKNKNARNELRGTLKWRQQKLKSRQLSNCSSSEHDNELDDKAQQARDMDIKYRSPFVLIKGDGSVSIVNTANFDDNADKANNKFKKSGHERKNVKGTYSSTLSNKYDADTADSTWVCIFCKRGPHRKGLGDLFGPYSISVNGGEYNRHSINSNGDMTSGTNHPNAGQYLAATFMNNIEASTKKPITNQMEYESLILEFLGEYSTSTVGDIKSTHQNGLPQATLPNTIEIWFHEDCSVWAPNLFLVGSRLVGLENAIWSCSLNKCTCCGKLGAGICCLERDCDQTVHLICARENSWMLDETKLWAHCAKHVHK
ncbi:uncharacterized protein CG5098 [Haematobia irritans]|uniref:uncharacterized protein CG5098 n=1 Tax=Haematobia irritans TaxID=7368 RepID=UPI003F4FB60E